MSVLLRFIGCECQEEKKHINRRVIRSGYDALPVAPLFRRGGEKLCPHYLAESSALLKPPDSGNVPAETQPACRHGVATPSTPPTPGTKILLYFV
jgi:hypothetical protein